MSPHARARLAIVLASIPVSALIAMIPLRDVLAQCLEPIQFADQVKYVTGEDPPYVATADFNEDGIADLAVANSYYSAYGYGANISIFLGHGTGGVGNGGFGTPAHYPCGARPYGIAVGDYNGDDILDLAVTNYEGTTVTIVPGLGTGGVGWGTFGPPSGSFEAGLSPFHVVNGDFNQDGILDLAVSNNAEARVSVLIGQGSGGVGDGTFAYRVQYPLQQLSTGIATADLNEDGILDLVATENYEGDVAVLIGQGSGGIGDGTFYVGGHYAIGPEPVRIVIADLNSDGILDVVAANGAGAGTFVLFGNGIGGVGNGTLGPGVFVIPSGNSGGVAVADFNLDGLQDVAVTVSQAFVDTELRLYPGNGSGGNNDGTFDIVGATAYPVGSLPPWIAVDDFNGDGKPDAVVPNYHSDFISVLLSTCEAGPTIVPEFPQLVDVRDVPNDQGGKVFLEWLRSGEDETGGSVNSYRVWRRIPPHLAGSLPLSEVGRPGSRYRATEVIGVDGETTVVFWEALADLPAQRLEGYGYTAATTQDSLPGSNPYTAFFVTALTENIDVFYNSEIDSAYSVDNLAPAAPRELAGVFETSTGVILEWDPNTESDLSHYAIYRGATEDFVPSAENRIGTSSEPGFVDTEGLFNYYKVSAIDIHTNESVFAGIASEDIPIPTLIKLFAAEIADDGVHLTVELSSADGNATVTILRAAEPAIERARTIAGPRSIGSGRFEFIDPDVRPGVSYWYWLELRLAGKLATQQGPIRADGLQATTLTTISPAAPNPFAGRTTFSYVIGSDLANGGDVPVSLKLYGPSGRLVRTLISGSQGAGEYRVLWNGAADSGARVNAGVYYYRFRIGAETRQGRVVMIQ
jgi:hypothetical protein